MASFKASSLFLSLPNESVIRPGRGRVGGCGYSQHMQHWEQDCLQQVQVSDCSTSTTLLIHHLLTQCTSTWQGGLVSSNSSHLFGTLVKPTRGSQRPKLSHDLVGSINPHNTNLALLNMRISTGTSHTSPSCVTHIMRMSSTPRQVVS